MRCYGPVLVLAALLAPRQIDAAWDPDGNLVSAEFDAQFDPRIAPDGAGGAVLSWSDNRAGNQDVYAQHFNSSGTMLWTTNGVAVCTQASRQGGAAVVSSGGGAIIAWTDQRNGGGRYDIYAQKIAAAGVPAWAPDGIALSTAPLDQGAPVMVSDGADGAILAWIDSRNGNLDVYAHRVSLSGTVVWPSNGVPVAITPDTQTDVRIIPAGAGAIVVWRDFRDEDGELYAQRLASDGTPMWTADGRPVTSGARLLGGVTYGVTSDGADGCIVAWHDLRIGAPGIYAQRLLATGEVAWISDVPMTLLPVTEGLGTSISSDGNGGAVAAWEDYRDGEVDVYAQRVNANGTVTWPANGVPVVDTTGTQLLCAVTLDPRGTIVTVRDNRSGDPDIYAQLVDHDGTRRWGQGSPMCVAPGSPSGIRATPATSGGAFLVWSDYRNDEEGDLYANYTDSEVADVGAGDLRVGSGSPVALLPNAPNPFRTETRIRYSLSQHHASVLIEVFDPQGRRIWESEQEAMGAGHYSVPFRAVLPNGRELPAGVYPYRIRTPNAAQQGRIVVLR